MRGQLIDIAIIFRKKRFFSEWVIARKKDRRGEDISCGCGVSPGSSRIFFLMMVPWHFSFYLSSFYKRI